ncbi:hypothetical protein [Labilibaculum sp.]|uniref:hypothetical protein n=1 Tax=Labilibaculum sp. TaxID=2060723 RepID=UPI00356A3C50
MTNKKQNILLIAGTGRNVGKTLFACQLIENVSCKNIVSIKISPHFHLLNKEIEIIKKTKDFVIAKENQKSGTKDSNRMLRAGSKEVYYVQAKDKMLPEILSYFEKKLKPEDPIICESGGLRDFIEPGLFLMINKKNNEYIKPRAFAYEKIADKWIEFDGENFNLSAKNISFINQQWKLINQTI